MHPATLSPTAAPHAVRSPTTRSPPRQSRSAWNPAQSRVTRSSSNKLQRDAPELTEVGVQRIALAREHDARERTGENEVTGLERHAVLAELVGEPGDAERGMAEHASSDAGLLDLGIAIHDAADPAQVDLERPDRPAADDDAGCSAVVGNGVENFARVLQPGIDDLDRRDDIFGGAQHVGQTDSGAAQRLAENEGELDLDPRQTEILVRHARAVGDHHVVEEMPVIWLVDLR